KRPGRTEVIIQSAGSSTSLVNTSDFSTDEDKVIKLHTLLPDSVYDFIFEIEAVPDDTSNILRYGIVDVNEVAPECCIETKGSEYRIVTQADTSSYSVFSSNTQFRIRKCQNQVFFYEDNMLKRVESLSGQYTYTAYVQPVYCFGPVPEPFLSTFIQLE